MNKLVALLAAVLLTPAGAAAQQQAPVPPAGSAWSTSTPLRSTFPASPTPPGNTTDIQKQSPPPAAKPAAPPAVPLPAGNGQVTLTALLTDEGGQKVDTGLIWRVYQEKATPDNRPKLVTEIRQASPTLRLPAGDYLVNVAFGRANVTRRLTLRQGEGPAEKFILNAGGLKLAALVEHGAPAPPMSVSFDIFSDERDQFGNRSKIVGGIKPGVILRLNSGLYNVVSTYGDANAQVRADVSVEAGKLTEVTVAHAVGKATFKLVTRVGGEAIADTQWSIATNSGEVIKESVGALPTHLLLPGTYIVTARSQGRTFTREFTIQHNDAQQVEVLVQ